jgi:hypothetical protein
MHSNSSLYFVSHKNQDIKNIAARKKIVFTTPFLASNQQFSIKKIKTAQETVVFSVHYLLSLSPQK